MSPSQARAVPAVPGVVLGETLGTGAFGQVYRGQHVALGIDVAVKVVAVLAGDQMHAERVVREARLMARLDHPNLLRIFGASWVGQDLVLVLELMDGGSLESRHNMPPDELVHVARQLLAGLQALHTAGVIHRDIKPGNCLRRVADQRIKLGDLGIAVEDVGRTAELPETAGTIPFMAPELFDLPAPYSTRSDLYALGMTLACLALDRPPFPDGGVPALLEWVQRGARPQVAQLRPDVEPTLTRLIQRMMSPRRDHRPDSAAAALAELMAPTSSAAVAGPRAAAVDQGVGPWLLVDQVYASSNWHGFAATHADTGSPVRVTFLQPGGPLRAATPLVLAAAEFASRLDHAGLLPVLDWGERNGLAWVATAPPGRALDEVISGGGPLAEVEALDAAISVADALAYLHGQALVYQMVEPGSVVMAQDAQRAILSWPVFCVRAGGPAYDEHGRCLRVASGLYAAPEFAAPVVPIEPSVDCYGLGEVLYYLLTGCAARRARDPQRPWDGAPDVRSLAPHVTAPTARAVAGLLDADRQRRPSASEAARTLRCIADRIRH